MAKILVVDDDELFRELLCTSVSRHGHVSLGAENLAQARRILADQAMDVVYMDVRLPDGSGALALEELRAVKDPPEVIIITGQGDPDGAELALRCGAWDYIEKPASVDRMTLPMLRALSYRAEKRRQRIPALPESSGIVGKSPRLASCLAQAGMAAASGVTAELTLADVPFLPEALSLSTLGLIPAGSIQNRNHYLPRTLVRHGLDELLVTLAFDAQTSGGLILGVPEGLVPQAQAMLDAAGDLSVRIGRAVETLPTGQALSLV